MSKLTEARDIILQVLRHRLNLTLTDYVCQDAANNAAQALMPLLENGILVTGSTGGQPSEPEPEPAPYHDPGQCSICDGRRKRLEDGDTAIGVVRAPRQNPGDGETADEHARRVIK